MVRYGTVRYGMVRYGTARYGTAWYGTVRHGTVRYGTVRYGNDSTSNCGQKGLNANYGEEGGWFRLQRFAHSPSFISVTPIIATLLCNGQSTRKKYNFKMARCQLSSSV
jgi:hypothetical protein